MASPTEDSGQFGIGTFDNAQFDTIEQPSTVNVFSTETVSKTLNKTIQSTVNVFSDLGREIQRDLTSFIGTIQSTVDAQKQILRVGSSFATVFSQSDFRLGKKVISTIKSVSQTDRTASLFRNPVSTVKAVSKPRIIFELVTKSKIKVVSQNNFFQIFNRQVTSFVKSVSQAFQELSLRDANISSAINKAQNISSSIKTKTEKTLNGDINK